MNDLAFYMQEFKTYQDLLSDFFAELHGYSLVVIPLDDFEKIDGQNLENETEMIAIWTFEKKRIEQLNNLTVIFIKKLSIFLE